jgi:hypothetical protein
VALQQPREVLLRAQEVLLQLAQAQERVRVLEALLRVQEQVLVQVQAEVLDLALVVGLQQVVREQGQVELARVQEQE